MGKSTFTLKEAVCGFVCGSDKMITHCNTCYILPFFRIGDMGEFSTINAIKPIMKDVPSFCVRGLKLSEHLGKELKKLGINFGKEDAEMDIVNISCNNDKLNVMFGECKVSKVHI